LTQQQLGERIARARERLGLSQAELAERVDLSQSAISRIESAGRGVDSLELAAIADSLDVSVLDLLETEPLAEELRLAARLDDVTEPAVVDRAVNRVLDVVRLDRLLDDLGEPEVDAPERPEMQAPRGSAIEQGKRLAERVRQLWQLGDDPLPPNLFSLVEDRTGLGVALEPLQETIAGLCARLDDIVLVLVDSSATYGRQRFTLAHELCHCLVGDGDRLIVDERLLGRRSNVEMRANAFAAHFLMPAKAVRRYLRGREVNEEVVVELQYTFGVSLDALLWHLISLDLISDYRRDQINSTGAKALAFRYGYETEWARLEQERGQRRPPRPLHQRALRAYAKGRLGIEPLADLIGRRDLDALRRDLEDHGIVRDERWWEESAPA
jgi:Zn-dependent peptidase ImmA (M78 family)/DNA-binding XRE family transcriptional regulator